MTRTLFGRSRPLALPMLLLIALSACAAGRSVIDVQPPPSREAATEGKVPVKIAEVRDLRKFEASPRSPSTPSLGDASQLNDPAITSRAVARKRGGFGLALGDVLLPEGHTVAGLVRDAARQALEAKGYRVVDDQSPDFASALPLTLDVNEFWSWFTPGFFEVTVDFAANVHMKGRMVAAGDAAVRGEATYGTVAVFESTWTDVIQRGVANLSEQMKAKIVVPAQASSAAEPQVAAVLSEGMVQ